MPRRVRLRDLAGEGSVWELFVAELDGESIHIGQAVMSGGENTSPTSSTPRSTTRP